MTSTFNLMAATPETNQNRSNKTDIEKSGADSKEATEKNLNLHSKRCIISIY